MTVSTAAITFVDFPQDKVTLAGNCGVGKTTLFLRFKTGQFVDDVESVHTEGEFRKYWPLEGEQVSVSLFYRGYSSFLTYILYLLGVNIKKIQGLREKI